MIGRLVTAAGLVAGLLAVSAPPATSLTTTSVRGWSTAAASVTYAGAVSDQVRVLTGGAGRVREVRLQHRRAGTSTWTSRPAVTTSTGGWATLRWTPPRVAGRYELRAYAVPTATAAGRVTALRAVTVREDWPATLVRLTNQARATGRSCGGQWYPAVDPLRRDARLDTAATRHARDMARRGYFSHDSLDGTSFSERITAAGYSWSRAGENIAAGQGSPWQAMAAWLDSPGHCANIMSGSYADLGVGYAYLAGSPYTRYWVQDFATSR